MLRAKAARVIDLDDVGVREAGHGAGFALDADFGFGGVLVMMEVDAQEFDGEFAIEFGIVGGVDGADGAAGYGFKQDVSTDRGSARGMAFLGGKVSVFGGFVKRVVELVDGSVLEGRLLVRAR